MDGCIHALYTSRNTNDCWHVTDEMCCWFAHMFISTVWISKPQTRILIFRFVSFKSPVMHSYWWLIMQHMKGSRDALWHQCTTERPAGNRSLLARTCLARVCSCSASHRTFPGCSILRNLTGIWNKKVVHSSSTSFGNMHKLKESEAQKYTQTQSFIYSILIQV